MIASLKGVNGVLELYEDKIVIIRKGVLAKITQGFTKGDKTIYIRNITGIDFRKGGSFVNGYLEFTMSGGNERKGGAFDATSDENTLMIGKPQNKDAQWIKDKIESLQINNDRGNSSFSPADELLKFKELYDADIISEEEFQNKKKELLG